MTNKERYMLPEAPPPAMKLPLNKKYKNHRWDGSEYTTARPNRKYTARMAEGMLEITAYSADGIPLWRTWQDENRVLGQTMGTDPKPSESTVGSRKSCEYAAGWYSDPESDEIIRTWVRDHQSGYGILTGLELAAWSQTKIRHKKRDEKWDRIRQEIDNRMVEIREPPKDFLNWVTRDAFVDRHYIIYQYRKAKTTDGFCTRCRHEVEVRAPRNRQPGTCPRCHSKITFLSEASLAVTNGKSFRTRVAFLQPVQGGFCIRSFNAYMELTCGNYKTMKAKVYESFRSFYDFVQNKVTDRFAYEEFETSGQIRWCRSWNRDTSGVIYPKNIKKLFAGTAWRYVPMADLARKCGQISAEEYIKRTREDPAVEHLAKHGLWKLAADVIDGRRTSPKEVTTIRDAMGGLDMDEIRMLARLNVGYKALDLYNTIRKKRRPTEDMMRSVIKMGFLGEAGVLKELLNHTTVSKMEKYLTAQIENLPLRNEYSWEKRRYADRRYTIVEAAGDWRDYIQDAQDLKWNLKSEFVLYPRNLKQAHTQSIKAKSEKKLKLETQKIKKALKKLTFLSWRGKEYLIRLPDSAGEIVAEGHALHHCVAGYAGRVAEGETVILFVRKVEDPKNPLVTVELNPESFAIRQARGMNNRDPSKEVKKFLENWKQRIQGIKNNTAAKAG